MKTDSIYVLLENIRSAYNVGSIFRTCDAAGIDTLFLTGFTPYPPHPKLNKTALGSLTSVNWEWYKDPIKLISNKKKQGVSVIAMESDKKARSVFEVKPTYPCCLIFGNEIQGISKKLLNHCDQILTIPQFGYKESLNVAVSAGIAIYEMRRKSLRNVSI